MLTAFSEVDFSVKQKSLLETIGSSVMILARNPKYLSHAKYNLKMLYNFEFSTFPVSFQKSIRDAWSVFKTCFLLPRGFSDSWSSSIIGYSHRAPVQN